MKKTNNEGAVGAKKLGTVMLGGLKSTVYSAKDLQDPEIVSGKVLGRAVYDSKNIYILEELGVEMRKLVLFHEITHQIDDLMDTGLSEAQVDGISKGIYAFLVHNPKWMELVK